MLIHTILTYWKKNLVALIFTALESGSIIISTVFLANIMNSLIDFNSQLFIQYFLLSLLAWGCALLFGLIRLIYVELIKQEQIVFLKNLILKKITKLTYEEFHTKKSSEYTSWLTNDINIIEEQGFGNLYSGMSSATLLLFSAIAILQFHWILLIVSLTLSFTMTLIPKFFKKNLDKKNTTLSKTFDNYTVKIDEWINGFDTLYYHNKTKLISQKLFNVISEVKQDKLNLKKEKTYLYTSIRFASIFAQYSIILVSGIMILSKTISVGSIFSIGDLTGNFFGNTSFFIDEITNFLSASTISEKMNKIIEVANLESKDSIPFSFTNKISVNNVSYNYGNKKILIPNMSFVKGEKYAITGKSGSGKTTFLNILTKNYNNFTGEITFDDISLKDICAIDIKNHISYTPQKNYIFDMNLIDNITLESGYSNNIIDTTLQEVELSEESIIERDSLGINGVNLSGGQAQRVALARGIVHAKDILIIDEGTSSLDKKTAEIIERNILKNSKLTVIFVTHHLHPELKNYFDKIYSF